MHDEKLFHVGIKALIVNENQQILLLKVNPDSLKDNKFGVYWDIPGGRIQSGDSVMDTLVRELGEETGLTEISSCEFFHATISPIEIPTNEGTVGLVLMIYKVGVDQGGPMLLSDEHSDYAWKSFNEAADLLSVKFPSDFTERLRSF